MGCWWIWVLDNTVNGSALKFTHIDTNSLSLLDDFYCGEDGIHYFLGAVMEDASGNLATVFARAGASVYAGAYYTTKPSGGTIDPAFGTLRPSEASSCAWRWGDYAGAWIGPNDNSTFWVFHEYAIPGDMWNTWSSGFTAP
jgi:hypothetical protein